MALLDLNHSIYVSGSKGMVGSAICKKLRAIGYTEEKKNLITCDRNQLDLTDHDEVAEWFKKKTPDVVILAAAKVGGIIANQTSPVDFLLENLKIQNNLIELSFKFDVKRLLFLGSSCIYPKFASQPIQEYSLLTKPLEDSNQWYSIAKIAGLKLCEAYRKQFNFDTISLMPTNLYGPGDNYTANESHVMASMIRKFYEAKNNNNKEVICWGSGKPLREFLYVDDLAEACIHVLKKWAPNKNNSPLDNNSRIINWMNVGCSHEISIKDLAHKIANIIDFQGEIIWDSSKPDGTPRKKLDTKFINKLGWSASTDLDEGIKKTLESFKQDLLNGKLRT